LKGNYYFAHGKRVDLSPDPNHVAVDLERAAKASLPRARREALLRDGQELRAKVVLIARRSLGEGDRRKLDRAGALLPTFRAEGATIVVLPEVRVELRDSKQIPHLARRLHGADVDPTSVKTHGSRFSFAPASGRAEDALRLANELYEELEPDASQARFLRVVPRQAL